MIETAPEFESILDRCCEILTAEARREGFDHPGHFEKRVRDVMSDLTGSSPLSMYSTEEAGLTFPCFSCSGFGIDVEYTESDRWSCASCTPISTPWTVSASRIYVIFCKMGGTPEVRWKEFESSVTGFRASLVPRLEIDLTANPDGPPPETVFDQMGESVYGFRRLGEQQKMDCIRNWAHRVHPDGRFWWMGDSVEHSLPIQARLYTSLPTEEKKRLRAEAALVCPGVVKTGRRKNKYNDAVLYMLTYHGVLCHQARDLFSAGSVANPKNDKTGGPYIVRALKLLEDEMRRAALEMEDVIFEEYWGESVPPKKRIRRWLEKADAIAWDWKPSDVLFRARS